MIKTEKILLPLSVNDVEKFYKKNLDFVVITNQFQIISYCIENDISYLEYSKLINIESYKEINISKNFKILNKKNLNEIEIKYSNLLKYNLSHVLKTSYLSELIYRGIRDKIKFKEICINYNILKLPYGRSNLNSFINLLLFLKFKPYQKNIFSKMISLRIILILTILLNFFSNIIFFTEFLYYKIFNKKFIYREQNSENKKILFFSGGRDFTFHSILSKNLKNYKLICYKGDSIHDMSSSNNFNSIINFQNTLLSGFFFNKIKNNYNSTLIKNNILFHINSRLLKSILSNYFLFRIKRDYKFMNSAAYTINKINPVLVFSSSLSLPIISACFSKIKTVSEFEGFGIDHNPMAPYLGDYIFCPGPFSHDQVLNYSSLNSIIIKNGAYYA